MCYTDINICVGVTMKKNGVVAMIEAFVMLLLVMLASYFDVFYTFDTILKDNLYQTSRGINNKIKIIAIDDKTLRSLGAFGTWSRGVYADVINILSDTASVITLDIMIFDEMDAEGDAKLTEACRKSGRVVCGSYINYTTVYKIDENGEGYIDYLNISEIHQPIIGDACETGFVNVAPDNDAIVRSTLLSAVAPEVYGDAVFDSLAAKTYSLYCAAQGTEPNNAALDNGKMWISYAGKPGDYEHISLIDVLDGTVDPRVFTDCMVFVGAYETGLQDQYPVPNSSDMMYGVEIHANIVQGLLDGKCPVTAGRLAAAAISGAIAAVMYVIFRFVKIKFSTPLMFAVLIGYVAAGIALNGAGIILPLIYTLVSVAVAYLVNLGRHYGEATLEKRKITNAFKKYVAPQVVEEIAKTGSYHIKLGGENRNIAVLFVDIRGFTPMSESLEPEQVVDILNSYLNLTTNAIFDNGGTLDKFIGDATMAVFNAPFDLDDYVFRAAKTALDIVAGANAIESKFLEKYGKSVGFGVGVNCGNAVVGNIGCDFRMDYTAIGDTVNTAARLEANAKRGQVLISQAVYDVIGERITAAPIGEIPLKGKSNGVFVYSLTGVKANSNKITGANPDE